MQRSLKKQGNAILQAQANQKAVAVLKLIALGLTQLAVSVKLSIFIGPVWTA